MRLLLTTLLVLLPGLADAQRHRPPAPEPPASTLPPIGLPLPQIGLRLAPIGLAPPVTSTTSEPAASARRHHSRPPSRKGRTGPGVVYVMPAYPWDWYGAAVPGTTDPAAAAEPVVTPVTAARLRLEVEPRGVAEIYVDGYFVGTADDRRDEVALEPGSHRVDIRAPGYESERVDVRLEAGESATLRRSLQREGGAPPLPRLAPATEPAPIARKPFYFIPGCYLGDVPPKDAGLPATCDQSKTVVVKP